MKMIVDFNTHPFMIREMFDGDPGLEAAVRDVFGLFFPAQPLSVFLGEMDAAGVDRSVLLPIDCTSAHGCKIVTNEAIAELCGKYPRLIGFASVDPASRNSVEALHHAVGVLGLVGLNLDPALQRFQMSSEDIAYPIYRACAELNIPVLIHCGLNWAPKARIGDGNPIDLEPAVVANPGTNFVIAHLGWPWVNEATALAMKYSNVYLDTSVVYSGTPADCLNHVINRTIGKHVFENNLVGKVVYGSNYPRADMRRTVRGVMALGFSDYFCDHLFYLNANQLMGAGR